MKLFKSRIIYFLPVSISLYAHADFTAQLNRVIDGDTLEVVRIKSDSPLDAPDTVRIRLTGIDAPESKQAYGQDAKTRLSELVTNRSLRVKEQSKDRYGRTLAFVTACKVRYAKGTESCNQVNYTMVSEGLAWAYRYHNRPSDRVAARLEASAKVARIGLWASDHPVEPWRWRKLHR